MIELINANTLSIPLAAQSVHMIAFSPPYWGLRAYAGTAHWVGGDPECDHSPARKNGDNTSTLQGGKETTSHKQETYKGTCLKCGATREDAQLGSEPLHDCLGWARGENCGECFVCHLRQVAAECWRVLRDDGVMWVNLGDSYAGSWGAMSHELDGKAKRTGTNARPVTSMLGIGLKPKDLVGIPWRVALALQSDGWYLRSEIIWAKPNPMPESVTDRPTKAHEQVFLFSKRERYFYDAEAVREAESKTSGGFQSRAKRGKISHGNGETGQGLGLGGMKVPDGSRNARTVWTIATAPYSGSHFATWPPALVERMIKAGTSERGACPKCGKQWERVVEKTGGTIGKSWHDHTHDDEQGMMQSRPNIGGALDPSGNPYTTKTLGWQPTCTCGLDTIPAIVLDPFAGSGTTLMVARKLGRSAVGLDLSYTYLHDNARERLMLDALEEWESGKKAETSLEGLPMFGGAA